MAEEIRFLLQINIDAAVKNLIHADVIFIGADRSVCWNECYLMSFLNECCSQRIIVKACAAIHPRGSGCDISDPHRYASTCETAENFVVCGKNFLIRSLEGAGVRSETTINTSEDTAIIKTTGMIPVPPKV